MSDENIGISIHNSFRLVENVGREIEGLFQVAQLEINKAIENIDGMKISEEWDTDCSQDDNGWVVKDYACYIGLTNNRGRSTKKFLNIQVSLSGGGMSAVEGQNNLPLLHVSLWDDCTDFGDTYMELERNEEELSLQEGVLFNWAEKARDWLDQEWTYSLYLTSINDVNDIQNKIVQPFVSLVKNQNSSRGELTNIEGIVCYEKSPSGAYFVKNMGCNQCP